MKKNYNLTTKLVFHGSLEIQRRLPGQPATGESRSSSGKNVTNSQAFIGSTDNYRKCNQSKNLVPGSLVVEKRRIRDLIGRHFGLSIYT